MAAAEAAARDTCGCGHSRWTHKRGAGPCGEWPCRCDRYQPEEDE